MTDSTEVFELAKIGSQLMTPATKPVPKPAPQARPRARFLAEPVISCAMMAIFLMQTSLQNLYLRTACSVDLQFPQNVCASGVGESFREAEIASQQLVSEINVSRGFVGALISTVVLLFVGPWSDCSRRRRPLMIMSLLGMCVATACALLVVVYPVFPSVWLLYMVQVPMSFGGNFALLLAACFSYVGDVCHSRKGDVTLMMGRHRVAAQIFTVLGSVTGPLLFRYCGFLGVFPLVLALQVSALMYTIFCVEDVNVNVDNKVRVLDIRLPIRAAKCLVARRKHHRRSIVLLMILVALMERAILASEQLLLFMYTRNKFNWNDLLFGIYISYRNTVSFLGTLLILRVFKSRLKWPDELVGILSGVSLLLSALFFIGVSTTPLVFLVPWFAIISQGSQVVQRPIINRQIKPDEQGKIYCLSSALDQAFQMAISPAFSHLYFKTASTFPDGWLIPYPFIAAIIVAAYAVAISLSRKQRNEEEIEKRDMEKFKRDILECKSVNKEINVNTFDFKVSEELKKPLVDKEKVIETEEDICNVKSANRIQSLYENVDIEEDDKLLNNNVDSNKFNYNELNNKLNVQISEKSDCVDDEYSKTFITESNLNLKLVLEDELKHVINKVDILEKG